MELTKAVKPRISVTSAQEKAFRQMMEHYRPACDFCRG